MLRRCGALVLLIVLALLAVRCAPMDPSRAEFPAQGGREGTVTESTGQTTAINTEAEQPPETQGPSTPSTEVPSSEPGQVPGKAASVESVEGPEAVPLEEKSIDPTTWPIYKDEALGFSIAHPPDYVIKPVDEAALAQLRPAPLAAVYFYSRQTAESDVAEIAPPEFSVRVYENASGRSLESWLAATGLASHKAGWVVEAYQGKHVSGVRASSPNYMAPGWSVYVASGKYIFQLTPLGLEAEAMLETFELLR